MDIRSLLHRSAWTALGAVLASCSKQAADPAYAERIGYRQDGQIVVFTPAGISQHDPALGSERGSIQLDASSGGVLQDEPFTFALSQNGEVAAVSFSNTEQTHRDVDIYDLASRKRRLTLDVEQGLSVPVQGVALDPEGTRAFVRARSWGMFDLTTGERLWGADSAQGDDCCGLHSPIFSADGQVLFGFNEERLEAHAALTGELLFSVGSGASRGYVGTLTHSGTDGVLLGTRTTARPTADGATGFQETYVFWSERDGSVVKELPQFPDRVLRDAFPEGGVLACSPAGDLCASVLMQPHPPAVSRGNPDLSSVPQPELSIAIWRTDGTLLQELPDYADGLAFSPDGGELAVAAGRAEVYRVDDAALVGSVGYTYDSY